MSELKKLEVSDFDKCWASKFANQQDNNPLLTSIKKLLEKMDRIHVSPEYVGVWTFYMTHGNVYKGESYKQELDKVREEIKKYEN